MYEISKTRILSDLMPGFYDFHVQLDVIELASGMTFPFISVFIELFAVEALIVYRYPPMSWSVVKEGLSKVDDMTDHDLNSAESVLKTSKKLVLNRVNLGPEAISVLHRDPLIFQLHDLIEAELITHGEPLKVTVQITESNNKTIGGFLLGGKQDPAAWQWEIQGNLKSTVELKDSKTARLKIEFLPEFDIAFFSKSAFRGTATTTSFVSQ